MTTLRERLDEYLVMRRALGFQLNDIERQVGLFCGWLEARGQVQTFIIDEAVTWARLNPDAHPSRWATRLSLVRRFAAYLHANAVDVPIIPAREFLCAAVKQVRPPHRRRPAKRSHLPIHRSQALLSRPGHHAANSYADGLRGRWVIDEGDSHIS